MTANLQINERVLCWSLNRCGVVIEANPTVTKIWCDGRLIQCDPTDLWCYDRPFKPLPVSEEICGKIYQRPSEQLDNLVGAFLRLWFRHSAGSLAAALDALREWTGVEMTGAEVHELFVRMEELGSA